MMKRTLLQLFFVLSCVVGFSGCVQKETADNKYSQTQQLMGTYVRIDTCRSDIKKTDVGRIYGQVWGRLQEIAWRMNVYDDKSDLAKINTAYPQAATVGQDTYNLIKQSLQISFLTGGTFDVTVWPLMELWKKAQSDDILPSNQDVKLVKEAVGSRVLNMLADNQVQLVHPKAKIDLGAIAKGYALDEAARIFRQAGVENFYIDAGGDIYVGGTNCQEQKWRIGIRDPKDKNNLLEVLRVSDAAVATSGNYEQHFLVKGRHFSHIINPVTGYPQQGIISATVIAPTGAEADALATALTVLGKTEGKKLTDRLSARHASLIVVEEQNGTAAFSSRNFHNFRLKQK